MGAAFSRDYKLLRLGPYYKSGRDIVCLVKLVYSYCTEMGLFSPLVVLVLLAVVSYVAGSPPEDSSKEKIKEKGMF